jgi:hypothetical protein
MRSTQTFVALLGFVASAQNQSDRPAVRPSALEVFATQPNTKLTWALEVGRIESTESRAILTAVEYESSLTPGTKLRGVRVELSKPGAADVVFIEENRLRQAATALNRIATSIPRYAAARNSVPTFHGSEEFRQIRNPVHTINPSYYVGPDSEGLAISAFKHEQFKLPSHSPSELATALTAAAEALEAR